MEKKHAACELTRQAHRTDVADFNEVPVTEAGSPVVHVHGGREGQLGSLVLIREENPLQSGGRGLFIHSAATRTALVQAALQQHPHHTCTRRPAFQAS